MTISTSRRRSDILFEQIRESNRELDGGIDSGARACLVDLVAADQSGPRARSGSRRSRRRKSCSMAEERVQARLAKDWQKSDELRDALQARGWEVRDTKDGQVVTRRAGA